MTTSACSPWGPPGSYTWIHGVQGSPVAYHVFEHGQEKQLYGADAFVNFMFLFWGADGSTTGVQLFDHQVKSGEFWKEWAMYRPPRRRVMSYIFDLTEGISPLFVNGVGYPKSSQVRWILGNDPFILAIGTDVVPVRLNGGADLGSDGITMGMTYALVSDANLDRTAVELIVLDKWPADWTQKDTYDGSEFEKQFQKELAEKVRRIPLDHPTTLREIMDKRMWEKPS